MSEPDDRIDDQDEPRDAVPPEEEPVPSEREPHDVHPDDEAHRRLEAQVQRAMADLANLRRRMHKEVEDSRRRAIEGLAAELLPVLDNFHLALGVKEQQEASGATFDPQVVVEGMRMVKSLLEGVLERHGLSEIRAEGVAFDPNLHEAVGVDAESDTEPGRVTRVLQRGYRIDDKVLRPTRVVVRGEASGARRKDTDSQDD